MAMMIYFDSNNTFTDFIDLERCGRTENTRPTSLLKKFAPKLKEIALPLFEAFSEETLQALLNETYEKLCLYTHSSIAVTMMIEVNKNHDEDLFKVFFCLSAYFLEVLIYYSLKYLVDDKKSHVDIICMMIGFALLCSKFDKNKLAVSHINKYSDYLHGEINETFTNKYIANLKENNALLSEFEQKIPFIQDAFEGYINDLIKNENNSTVNKYMCNKTYKF